MLRMVTIGALIVGLTAVCGCGTAYRSMDAASIETELSSNLYSLDGAPIAFSGKVSRSGKGSSWILLHLGNGNKRSVWAWVSCAQGRRPRVNERVRVSGKFYSTSEPGFYLLYLSSAKYALQVIVDSSSSPAPQ